MADDYNRPVTPPSVPPPVSGINQYGGTSNPDIETRTEPRRVARESGGGFGSGMLVAAVFIVVAILAALFFSGRGPGVPASADGERDGSNVTIDNTVAPADSGAATTAPAATTDAPATTGAAPTTDSVAPDPAAPAMPAPAPAPAQPAAPANP